MPSFASTHPQHRGSEDVHHAVPSVFAQLLPAIWGQCFGPVETELAGQGVLLINCRHHTCRAACTSRQTPGQVWCEHVRWQGQLLWQLQALQSLMTYIFESYSKGPGKITC